VSRSSRIYSLERFAVSCYYWKCIKRRASAMNLTRVCDTRIFSVEPKWTYGALYC